MGPNIEATFSVVEIKSIHCNRVPVRSVKAGQMCSILVSLKFCEKWLRQAGGEIRKGMVLLDYKDKINVQASFSFKADIWSYDGTIQCIKKTMQPVLLTQQVSQSCAIFLEGDTLISQYQTTRQMKLDKKKQRWRSNSMLDLHHLDENRSKDDQNDSDAQPDILQIAEKFKKELEQSKDDSRQVRKPAVNGRRNSRNMFRAGDVMMDSKDEQQMLSNDMDEHTDGNE